MKLSSQEHDEERQEQQTQGEPEPDRQHCDKCHADCAGVEGGRSSLRVSRGKNGTAEERGRQRSHLGDHQPDAPGR